MKQIKIFSNYTKKHNTDEDINSWILKECPFDIIKIKTI